MIEHASEAHSETGLRARGEPTSSANILLDRYVKEAEREKREKAVSRVDLSMSGESS